ncbi:MAG: sigma factor-like helix-turn-helix DNA-binding protein [Kofleriaceae bacterium]
MQSESLAVAWQRCRDARPDVRVELAAFADYLAARRPDDVTLDDQLATWCLDDLYLACACVAGEAAAVHAIERELGPIIDVVLSTWDRTVADETRQRLRAMLMVDHNGRGPLLAHYAGRGALGRWIRVVAAREAGKTRRADQAAMPVDDDALFDALVAHDDPQLAAIKHDAAIAFRAAFLATVAELDRTERTVLRLHILDGLTIDDIAPMYRVHRATIARWIGNAKQTLLERTRRRLMHELRLDGAEVDSLIRAVQSRIELTESVLESR